MNENPHLPPAYRQRLAQMEYQVPAPDELAALVRATAKALYAPTGRERFPRREEFNAFITDVLTLCNYVPAPERVAHDLTDLTDGAVVLDEAGKAHQLDGGTWLTVGDERESTPDTPVTVLREGGTR